MGYNDPPLKDYNAALPKSRLALGKNIMTVFVTNGVKNFKHALQTRKANKEPSH